MGRADGTAANGIGPKQQSGFTDGFSHTDRMACASESISASSSRNSVPPLACSRRP